LIVGVNVKGEFPTERFSIGSRRIFRGEFNEPDGSDQMTPDIPVRAFSTSGNFCLPNTNGSPLLAIPTTCRRIPEEPLVIQINVGQSRHTRTSSGIAWSRPASRPSQPPSDFQLLLNIVVAVLRQALKFRGLGPELLVQPFDLTSGLAIHVSGDGLVIDENRGSYE
jgi:hypothetical protein